MPRLPINRAPNASSPTAPRLQALARRLDQAIQRRLEAAMEPILPGRRSRYLYALDLRLFLGFAARLGVAPLPAPQSLVRAFLIHQVGAEGNVQAADRRAAAIGALHRALGFENPCRVHGTRQVRIGIRRQWGFQAPLRRRFGPELLLRCIIKIGEDSLADRRDRTLLLLGFTGGLGPTELAQLSVEHLRRDTDGLAIELAAHRCVIGREPPSFGWLCPVGALERWLDGAEIRSGPVFRALARLPVRAGAMSDDPRCRPLSHQGLSLILKARIAAAGLDADDFTLHSLRLGFLASASALRTGPFDPSGASIVRLSDFYPWL